MCIQCKTYPDVKDATWGILHKNFVQTAIKNTKNLSENEEKTRGGANLMHGYYAKCDNTESFVFLPIRPIYY